MISCWLGETVANGVLALITLLASGSPAP